MNEQEVLQILGRVNAVYTNSHIVYTSGKHGTAYVNKDGLYPHTKETSQLCRTIAEHFAQDGVEVVIAPVIGGVIDRAEPQRRMGTTAPRRQALRQSPAGRARTVNHSMQSHEESNNNYTPRRTLRKLMVNAKVTISNLLGATQLLTSSNKLSTNDTKQQEK